MSDDYNIEIDEATFEAIKAELKRRHENEYGTLAQIYPAAHTLVDDLDDPKKVIEMAIEEGIITIEKGREL